MLQSSLGRTKGAVIVAVLSSTRALLRITSFLTESSKGLSTSNSLWDLGRKTKTYLTYYPIDMFN